MPALSKKTLLNACRPLILALALALGLFFSGNASASIFIDDFETYFGPPTLGLAGQGDWTSPYSYSSSSDVISGVSYSALRSIFINHYDFVERQGIGEASSTLSFWFKVGNVFIFDGGPYVDFLLSNATSSSTKLGARVICYRAVGAEGCWNNGLSVEYLKTYGGYEHFATSTPSVWNNLQINWVEGTPDYARFKLNSGDWTNFIETYGAFSEIGSFAIDAVDGPANMDLYLDLISGSPSEGYIIPELGLPELPALEECSGYSVTERLLCELKNFFYRLFVPSPEKITELKNSIDLVKQRFPYNYIQEAKLVITEIKDSINEAPAEITILGNTRNIDMGFFGGEFRDLLKMFFRVIILLGFLFWAFSFLKRVFK